MSRKRQRNAGSASLLEAALRVLLSKRSDLVAGHEACVVLGALMQTSRSMRRVVREWVTQELRGDITRGHEGLTSIPARPSSADSTDPTGPTLSQLLLLMRFQYTSNVRIPVPRERHGLSEHQIQRLRLENDDVKRVLQGCCVRLYAAFHPTTGWGIHAADRIPCGEYVGEYTGELVSSAEASRRYEAAYDRTRLNYVLSLREHKAEGEGVVRTNVDATRLGCFTRFFNHSCEPTLRMEAVRVDSFVPRLALFTSREVAPGVQLTYDYGSAETHNMEQQQQQQETKTSRRGEKAVRCHCGTPTCRGMMPFDGTL